ncbi:nitrogen regulation protein NR(I) [uncultured Umboniibacter sp.]|uniref:nitrogen regulation protein NR(I) n=1 Tax=uncultured Umboniibacter sp. TaxID=1798917 RepID=UPI00262ED1DC|nr:nitrogen regulation protein NR(I) [uncultured Umboniibacter sp.]
MSKETVWIVDDDKSIRWVLEKSLSAADISTKSFASADDALNALDSSLPAVIISDIRMPGTDGLGLLGLVNEHHPNIPVIIMTAHSDLDSAVSSYEGGAFDYLPKPFDLDESVAMVKRALSVAKEHQQTSSTNESAAAKEIIGEAPAMQEVFRAIGRLAKSNITVLINGESGTGKELVAKALHRHSPRREAPFIALNMAAIPHDLIESELFGHEKGAFTGAQSQRKGRFEQANGGTLFLDEIGDMPADTQTRLLRVLADGEFYRVGGHQPVNVDVRIIAATHQDLEKLVIENQFREDLFHRLNVIRVHIPKLSDRASDIPALADHFLQQASQELQTECKALLPETAAFLEQLPWSGNVRQLENTCRWITVMAPGREVHLNDLPPELTGQDTLPKVVTGGQQWQDLLTAAIRKDLGEGKRQLSKVYVSAVEKALIDQALVATDGRKVEAAELIGWGRNTLTRKLAELRS